MSPSPSAGRSVATTTVVRVSWRRSARVPVSTMRPARMMLTRSQSASTSARMWLDSSTVRPSRRASRMQLLEGQSPSAGRARRSARRAAAARRRRPARRRGRPSGGCPSSRCAPFLVGSRSNRSSSSSPATSSRPPRSRDEQVDRLTAREVRPEVDVAGDVGEAAVQLDRVAPRVATEQLDSAVVGAHQAEQDPDGRGLAGPVGTEEAVHLAGGDLEVQAVEGPGGAEVLDQSTCGDRCAHGDITAQLS